MAAPYSACYTPPICFICFLGPEIRASFVVEETDDQCVVRVQWTPVTVASEGSLLRGSPSPAELAAVIAGCLSLPISVGIAVSEDTVSGKAHVRRSSLSSSPALVALLTRLSLAVRLSLAARLHDDSWNVLGLEGNNTSLSGIQMAKICFPLKFAIKWLAK
ncbi:hypothetical protein Dimus_001468 [Dionaea muscipula]